MQKIHLTLEIIQLLVGSRTFAVHSLNPSQIALDIGKIHIVYIHLFVDLSQFCPHCITGCFT